MPVQWRIWRWRSRSPRDKGPDPYDRKTVCVILLDGHRYEIASAQSEAAGAIVDDLYLAMTKQQTTPSATLHYRRGQLVVRVDQIVLVSTHQEAL